MRTAKNLSKMCFVGPCGQLKTLQKCFLQGHADNKKQYTFDNSFKIHDFLQKQWSRYHSWKNKYPKVSALESNSRSRQQPWSELVDCFICTPRSLISDGPSKSVCPHFWGAVFSDRLSSVPRVGPYLATDWPVPARTHVSSSKDRDVFQPHQTCFLARTHGSSSQDKTCVFQPGQNCLRAKTHVSSSQDTCVLQPGQKNLANIFVEKFCRMFFFDVEK